MSLHVAMRERTAIIAFAGSMLRNSAMVMAVAMPLTGCGGGEGGDGGDGRGGSRGAPNSAVVVSAKPPEWIANPHVVPQDTQFRGKTPSQWVVSFWQWALALPPGPLPHPFDDCNRRPISTAQTGSVWYWDAPISAQLTCNQRATTIPAGTSILLVILDGSSIFLPMLEGATSLNKPPIRTFTADQLRLVSTFANDIQDLFCTIDGVPVANITAYRTKTDVFSFSAPAPWIFSNTGGKGTSVADGYYLLLEPFSAGLHTIHYGGKFVIPAGVFGSERTIIAKDITLLIRVGS